MRKLLRFVTFLFAPVSYPYAGLYHFVVGAAGLYWLCRTHHAVYGWCTFLAGGWCGVLVGLVGVLVLGYSLVKMEEVNNG